MAREASAADSFEKGRRRLKCGCEQQGKIASWPVSRVLYGPAPEGTERGSHSSGTALARSLLQPTRMTRLETGWTLARPCHPYSVLLPVGFAVPSMLPCPRWALTPPFHPYSAKRSGLLSVALSLGSPPPDVIRHRVSVEPGLSSPRGLSALAGRGCPANWQRVINRPKRQAPEKSNVSPSPAWIGQRYETAKSVSYSGASRCPFKTSTAPSLPISSELLAACPLPPVTTARRSLAKPI